MIENKNLKNLLSQFILEDKKQNKEYKKIYIKNKTFNERLSLSFSLKELSYTKSPENPFHELFTLNLKEYINIIIVFDNCTFKNNVLFDKINCTLSFKNCTFNKKLSIKIKQSETVKFNSYNIDLSKEKIEFIGGSIQSLEIKNSNFQSKFYINPQYNDNNEPLIITELTIENTTFNSNFKLHNCDITTFKIEDTDFEKNADFFLTKIKKGSDKGYKDKTISKESIVFKSVNFRALALFGDTIFREKLTFKYVTFEGLSHFRNAEFHKGLDLDYANIQEEMNFFNVKELDNTIAKENTSQETYRIIKNNFENLGNKIEANKYHALELEQKKNNLKDDIKDKNNKESKIKKWIEYIVFQIHWISSEHSTNWLLVLYWILMVGLLSTIMEKALFLISLIPISFIISMFIPKIYYKLFFFLSILTISTYLTNNICFYDIIKNISLINLSKLPKIQDVSPVIFFNKVLLGYLYYQFILSIRKDTRK